MQADSDASRQGPMDPPVRRQRVELVIASAAVAAATAILYIFNPATAGLYPPCPFHALTGLWCPGCGTLRALNRLLHADFAQALRLNLLVALWLPYMLYGFASRGLGALTGRTLPAARLPDGVLWAVAALAIAYGVARNIPIYPCTLLAP